MPSKTNKFFNESGNYWKPYGYSLEVLWMEGNTSPRKVAQGSTDNHLIHFSMCIILRAWLMIISYSISGQISSRKGIVFLCENE